MKLKVFILMAGLSLVGPTLHAQERTLEPLEPANICESSRFKQYIDAIECMAKNCDDPNGEKKKIYELACSPGRRRLSDSTLAEPARRAVDNQYIDQNVQLTPKVYDDVKLKANLDGKLPQYAPERPLEPLEPEATATVTPLSPCDCLALLDKKEKEDGNDCHIELCAPPQQPEQPQPPKAVVPEAPAAEKKFLFEGSGCSLEAFAGTSDAGLWLALVTVASAFGIRRKK